LGFPQFVVKYNVSVVGPTQDSLTLQFVDSLSANFSTLLGLVRMMWILDMPYDIAYCIKSTILYAH